MMLTPARPVFAFFTRQRSMMATAATPNNTSVPDTLGVGPLERLIRAKVFHSTNSFTVHPDNQRLYS